MTQRDIMIVDDNPENLKLLEDMLMQHGHVIHSFPRGRLALAAASRNPPDLILLDINMPEMDGYQVCELLKSNSQLAEIPIIFLSGLNETEDKVKAFRAGAADYISKPFQLEEVQARVETHLRVCELSKALRRHNEGLEQTVAARTRELAEANRKLGILDGFKSDFLRLISHEFRTPLNGILGIGEVILSEMPSTPENAELRQMYEQSRQRILSILEDALLLGHIDVCGDQFRTEQLPLVETIRCGVKQTETFARSRDVFLQLADKGDELVCADRFLLTHAWQSLIETSVKLSRAGGTVLISPHAEKEHVSVSIESAGRTIPDSALPKFFDLMAIAEAITPGGDLGLGPPVASRILKLFGASVTVQNSSPAGVRLDVSFQISSIPDRPNNGLSRS